MFETTLADRRLSFVFCAILLAVATGCDRSPSRAADEPRGEEQTTESASPDSSTGDESADESTGDSSDRDTSVANEEAAGPPDVLLGRVAPGKVTETYEAWRNRLESVEVPEKDARALKEVPPGAEVTVYFGTWCPDSRREVTRLWRALETAGGDVPLSIEYIALDRNFEAGDVEVPEDIDYVPTFVVHRDGKEVGRIVESAPDRLERDLRALLTGDKEGVLSGRSDL